MTPETAVDRGLYAAVGKIVVPILVALVSGLIVFSWNQGREMAQLIESEHSQNFRLTNLENGAGPMTLEARTKVVDIERRLEMLESERMKAIEERLREIRDYQQRILDRVEKHPVSEVIRPPEKEPS